MEITVQLRKNINWIFAILCLTLAAQLTAGTAAGICGTLWPELSPYTVHFLIPQTIYPLLTAGSMLIFLLAATPASVAFFHKPEPITDLLFYIPTFLGLSLLASRLSEGIIVILEAIGIKIPSMTQYFPSPSSPVEMAGYFLVIAILPSICEELLFRAGVAGVLASFNCTAAVFFSALSFSLIHATVQQIPGAFLLGLLLADVYLHYKNLAFPVLLHFINNAVSCLLNFLALSGQETAANGLATAMEVILIPVGLLTGFVLLRRRKKASRSSADRVTTRQAFYTGLTSVPFLLFSALYLALTVLSFSL